MNNTRARFTRVNTRVLTRKIGQFRVTLRDITPKPHVTRDYAKAI